MKLCELPKCLMCVVIKSSPCAPPPPPRSLFVVFIQSVIYRAVLEFLPRRNQIGKIAQTTSTVVNGDAITHGDNGPTHGEMFSRGMKYAPAVVLRDKTNLNVNCRVFFRAINRPWQQIARNHIRKMKRKVSMRLPSLWCSSGTICPKVFVPHMIHRSGQICSLLIDDIPVIFDS